MSSMHHGKHQETLVNTNCRQTKARTRRGYVSRAFSTSAIKASTMMIIASNDRDHLEWRAVLSAVVAPCLCQQSLNFCFRPPSSFCQDYYCSIATITDHSLEPVLCIGAFIESGRNLRTSPRYSGQQPPVPCPSAVPLPAGHAC